MNNNRPFIYPSNTGIAYSFTDDGYFETAWYRFQANGQSANVLRSRGVPVLICPRLCCDSLEARMPDRDAVLAARHRAPSLSPSRLRLRPDHPVLILPLLPTLNNSTPSTRTARSR